MSLDSIYSFISGDERYEYKHRYYLLNQERWKNHAKEYRIKNREKIAEQKKQKITCNLCNMELSKASEYGHKQSKRHQKAEVLAKSQHK
jgi:hypothetical protein